MNGDSQAPLTKETSGGEVLSGCAVRATIQQERKSLPPGPARIAAQIAHATYHILDDYAGEDAQTGECTVEIPAHAWTELNRIIDMLGDDPHEVLHDLIGVNDPEPSERSQPWTCPECGAVRAESGLTIHAPQCDWQPEET